MKAAECCVADREFLTTIDLSSHDLKGKSWRDLLMWQNRSLRATSGTPFSADLQPEHNYAAWRSVTPELCAELFDRPTTGDVSSVFQIYFHTQAKRPTLAPDFTMGAALESALQSSEEPSPASALLEEARRLVSLVDEEKKRRHLEAIKSNDEAIDRWR
jgi:hypothetical protein